MTNAISDHWQGRILSLDPPVTQYPHWIQFLQTSSSMLPYSLLVLTLFILLLSLWPSDGCNNRQIKTNSAVMGGSSLPMLMIIIWEVFLWLFQKKIHNRFDLPWGILFLWPYPHLFSFCVNTKPKHWIQIYGMLKM